MQRLIFTEAWDHTISPHDRQTMENLFHQTKESACHELSFIIVRTAINHHNHLLVTVLIHNTSAKTIDLTTKIVQLLANDQVLAMFSITDSRLRIPANTSMPWTFIFTDVAQPADVDPSAIDIVTQDQG